VRLPQPALKAAGIDDKETLSKRRQKVTFDYHLALMEEVAQRFQAWYDEQHQSEHVPASHSEGGQGEEGAGGYDEDQIPVF
jgi:hypothetical protein